MVSLRCISVFTFRVKCRVFILYIMMQRADGATTTLIYTWLSFIVNPTTYYVCSLVLLIFASVSWAMVWQASWWNATHNPVKALLCVHTMNCKCCFVFHRVKTLFFNVVLQCLLIYYGYYIWIYLMTQDTMGYFLSFSTFFVFLFFLLICGCLDCCH